MDEQVHKQPEEPKTEAKPAGTPAVGKNRTLMACLAYVLFFIPMITGDSKHDEFVKYHTKQGFALFIVCVAIYIVSRLPLIGWMPFISLLNLCTFVLFIIGLVNAASDKKQPLPVIGPIGNWLKI
jgi:uncharacterized membrane protein